MESQGFIEVNGVQYLKGEILRKCLNDIDSKLSDSDKGENIYQIMKDYFPGKWASEFNYQIHVSNPTKEILTDYVDRLDFRQVVDLDLRPFIHQFPYVEWLIITDCPQVVLPPEIGHWPHLQKIYINKSHLTTNPPELGQCIQLSELHLSHNDLVDLPLTLADCNVLTTIDLAFNQCARIPPVIFRLTALRSLTLDDNPLTVAEDPNYGPIPSLKIFSAAQSHFPHLPSFLIDCSGLEQLTIFTNDWPSHPLQWPNIKRLTIASTNIHELPAEIGSLSKLEFLSIGHNPLVELPPFLCHFPHLHRLFLDGLIVREFPPGFDRLPLTMNVSDGIEQANVKYPRGIRSLVNLPPLIQLDLMLRSLYERKTVQLPPSIRIMAKTLFKRFSRKVRVSFRRQRRLWGEEFIASRYDLKILDRSNDEFFVDFHPGLYPVEAYWRKWMEETGLLKQVRAYYAARYDSLISQIQACPVDQWLTFSPDTIERLIHETPPDRYFGLEEALPASHPLLKLWHKYWSIQITTDHQIFL
jgi:Leucine-rich repeat (LRR) protein